MVVNAQDVSNTNAKSSLKLAPSTNRPIVSQAKVNEEMLLSLRLNLADLQKKIFQSLKSKHISEELTSCCNLYISKIDIQTRSRFSNLKEFLKADKKDIYSYCTIDYKAARLFYEGLCDTYESFITEAKNNPTLNTKL